MYQTPAKKRRVPQGPPPDRMKHTSAKYEARAFETVLRERMPVILQASYSLHAVMGIPPGTRILGNDAVILWTMPPPPVCSKGGRSKDGRTDDAGDVVVETAAPQDHRSFACGELSSDLDAKHLFADLGQEVLHTAQPSIPEIIVQPPSAGPGQFKLNAASLMPKRKREPSDPPKPQHRLARKRSRVDMDLTHSPLVEEGIDLTASGGMASTKQPGKFMIPQQKPESDTLGGDLPSEGALAHLARIPEPASPPPLNRDSFDNGNDNSAPIYWSHTLTAQIRSWLADPTTKSTQIYLNRLELRTASHHLRPGDALRTPSTGLKYEAKDYEKLKMIRMRLPTPSPHRTIPGGGNEQRHLDWLILVVISMGISGDGFASDSEQEEPEDEDELPYYVTAFPASQVTDVTTETYSVPTAGSPAKCAREDVEKRKEKTTLLLGRVGRVPLLHWRAIDQKFADEFMKACAEGRGVIEVVTEGALLLVGR